jgi:hypothetical protein
MIGPPGLPKMGRRIFYAAGQPLHADNRQAWKWITGLYLAGVLAHFGHHMAFDLPADHVDPTIGAVLSSAPTSLVWPADLIHTLIDLS